MKKKFIIFTLCFTLIFSSLNYKKTYADGGVISLPMLATVSALAVGTGIVINSNDDLYDIGRLFYDYINMHNDLTWSTVQSVFSSSVALQPNKLVSVDSKFFNIVKDFFDNTFYDSSSDFVYLGDVPFFNWKYGNSIPNVSLMPSSINNGSDFYLGGISFTYNHTKDLGHAIFHYYDYYGGIIGINSIYSHIKLFSYSLNGSNRLAIIGFNSSKGVWEVAAHNIPTDFVKSFDFPYSGGYTWDNVDSKKENDIVSLPIPGNLGSLVGQSSSDFWDNADNLINDGVVSLPNVVNPSIDLDSSTSFPTVDSDSGVVEPSVPSEGIWSTIKDFIISLVVPNDSFWTDTWGGLYNNFTDSFPMVDMSGFNDLVTGEKKFPNIDIDIMGITGRVVNGDVINSIVDWLRPIIAGFMMICLMLFNYRKIYKLIRNTEPFGGIAHGTSDFKTGISEYTHVGLVNDGFKRSEEEEFARSRYYEDMHFRNGGKL